jgi:hypothetical protein
MTVKTPRVGQVTTGRGGRGAGKAPVAPQRKGLALKAGAASSSAKWYQKRDGELAVVTAEAHNAALGITLLELYAPTEAQVEKNIVCKVRMHTLNGTDENITIFESDRRPGEIYMKESGAREVPSKVEGQPSKWYNDRKINDATRAQILSYVEANLE